MMSSKQRVVSGMRPTGKLHLGHYYGALKNWASLQDTYECFYFVADWHALTTEYAHPQIIKESIHDMVIDWLALGIHVPKSTIFVQSSLPEHAELHLMLSMITPLSWLERNPTYKEQEQELNDKDIHTHGFLGYPVLQAADILIYKAHKVPVGIDQVPHLELTREIGRRFNFLYREIFPLPDALLTETPKILGSDGRKMSKTVGNVISPLDLLEKYPLDALRYFLSREIPFDNDGDYSDEKFNVRYEADLANGIGNLANRILVMIEKYAGGVIPQTIDPDGEFINLITKKTWPGYTDAMNKWRFDRALESVWQFIAFCDQEISDRQPWAMMKAGKEKEVNDFLYHLAESLRHIAVMIWPMMPDIRL